MQQKGYFGILEYKIMLFQTAIGGALVKKDRKTSAKLVCINRLSLNRRKK